MILIAFFEQLVGYLVGYFNIQIVRQKRLKPNLTFLAPLKLQSTQFLDLTQLPEPSWAITRPFQLKPMPSAPPDLRAQNSQSVWFDAAPDNLLS